MFSAIENATLLQSQRKQLGFSQLKHRSKQKSADAWQELQSSHREVKRLKQTIAKMSHQSKNAILYFQTTIKQLEKTNQEYRSRLQAYESQMKNKRPNNITLSKISKSSCSSFVQGSSYHLHAQNKQNVNLMNSSQNTNCNTVLCQARLQLAQIRKTSTSIINTLCNLLYSVKMRENSFWSIEEYEKWAQKLQTQRKQRKSYSSKSSLQLVKFLQDKLRDVAQRLQSQSQKSEQSSDLLDESLRSLKQRQKGLMKVPFLQKIDLQQRRQDTECFIQSALLTKQRIIAKLQR